ncbi:MAG: DUF4202 domain-containing protein [Myxococcota bacterium]
MSDPERLRRALAALDAANADDPNTLQVRGQRRPKELAHAELASEWVEKLAPQAGSALRLAARAHHLRRWTIPRSDYPEGRAGYHRWRKALQALHAETARKVLQAEGFDDATIARVEALVQKKGLGRDPEVQVLEDALCLVFVETQLADLAEKLEPAKLEDVVRKTLRKMSPEAVQRAAELPLSEDHRALLLRIASE